MRKLVENIQVIERNRQKIFQNVGRVDFSTNEVTDSFYYSMPVGTLNILEVRLATEVYIDNDAPIEARNAAIKNLKQQLIFEFAGDCFSALYNLRRTFYEEGIIETPKVREAFKELEHALGRDLL